MLHWERLPSALQKSLDRWYLISAVSTCIALSSCTLLTLYAQFTHHQEEIPDISSAQVITNTPNMTYVKKPVQNVDFYSNFMHILEATPLHMQLITCVFDTKTYSCEGYVHKPHIVTAYIKQLTSNGFARITHLSTERIKEKNVYHFSFCVER